MTEADYSLGLSFTPVGRCAKLKTPWLERATQLDATPPLAPVITGAIATVLYALGALWQWRRQHDAPGADAETNPPSTQSAYALAVGLGAAALHAVCVHGLIWVPGGLDLSLTNVSALIMLVVVLFTLLANLRLPIANLLLLIFPLSALVLALRIVSGSSSSTVVSLSLPLGAHILVSIAAYAILCMAAAQSLLLWIQEKQLKARRSTGIARILPPMETMERLLFALLWTGLAVLTVAILSGFSFLQDMFGQRLSHHIVFACLAWVVFAVLLFGHKMLGWRGATAVRWTLIGFVLLLLGYLGSKFVVEVLLDS